MLQIFDFANRRQYFLVTKWQASPLLTSGYTKKITWQKPAVSNDQQAAHVILRISFTDINLIPLYTPNSSYVNLFVRGSVVGCQADTRDLMCEHSAVFDFLRTRGTLFAVYAAISAQLLQITSLVSVTFKNDPF